MKFITKTKFGRFAKIIVLFIMVIVLVVGYISYKSRITQNDISEAKQVVTNYFMALQEGNANEVNKTLAKFHKGLYNEDNISQWKPQILSIEYPGKFTNEHLPPPSYKANYGKNPYKSMNLYVEFYEGTKKQGYDYILIKETKDSPWLIHSWGQ